MKKKRDKRLVMVFLVMLMSVFCWYPVKHILLVAGRQVLDTEGNWKTVEIDNSSLLAKIETKLLQATTAVENRVSNYFPFYKEIMSFYNSANRNLNQLIEDKYVPVGTSSDGEYVVKDKENNRFYIISSLSNNELKKRAVKMANFYNELNKNLEGVKVNIYLPSRFEYQSKINQDLPYRNPSDDIQLFKDILDDDINIKELTLETQEEYNEYFFKSDHHWNIFGAYKGYLEIMDMLQVKNPTQIIENSFHPITENKYYGSISKKLRLKDVYDTIYDFKVSLPSYKLLINGESQNERYKPRSLVNLNKHNNEFYDYYVGYFEGMFGEVIYDFQAPKKDNLLIIADSYSWQIDYLIASNYNKTYIVNLRFDKWQTQNFNIKEYVEENEIKEVLILQETNSTVLDVFDWNITERIVW